MRKLDACLSPGILERDGVYRPAVLDPDRRAEDTWTGLARENAIAAAAATTSSDAFAKFPDWVQEHIAGSGAFLDAGCGYGRVSIPLLKAKPDLCCMGVDASPAMLSRFRALAVEHGVADRVTFYQGNLAKLPIRDASFDYVLSSGVLLHVPYEEAETILSELHRVLKPGGKLVLTGAFPNLLNLEGLQYGVYEYFHRGENGPVRPYSRRRVERLLAGYREVRIFSERVVLLPRQLGPLPLPFGTLIRAVNERASPWAARLSSSGWLVSHHEAVAVK